MNKICSWCVAVGCVFISFALASCSSVGSDNSSAKNSPVYSEQRVDIDNGEYKIPGILVTPKKSSDKKFPVMVMLHGTASQKNEVGGLYQRLAIYLAESGYGSLRIDFAGTGDSPVDYSLYSLSSASRDTKTALDFLAAQPAIDSGRMGLVGFSQGGLIAQLVAAQDARVKSLVTWSSVAGNGTGVMQFLFDQYYAEAKANGYAEVKFAWRSQPLNFGLQWFDEVKNNNSLDQMKNYTGKLLALAGDADPIVPYVSSINLMKAAGSSDAQAIIIKGADHMFNVLANSNANGLAEDQSTAEELLVITTEWVGRNL